MLRKKKNHNNSNSNWRTSQLSHLLRERINGKGWPLGVKLFGSSVRCLYTICSPTLCNKFKWESYSNETVVVFEDSPSEWQLFVKCCCRNTESNNSWLNKYCWSLERRNGWFCTIKFDILRDILIDSKLRGIFCRRKFNSDELSCS